MDPVDVQVDERVDDDVRAAGQGPEQKSQQGSDQDFGQEPEPPDPRSFAIAPTATELNPGGSEEAPRTTTRIFHAGHPPVPPPHVDFVAGGGASLEAFAPGGPDDVVFESLDSLAAPAPFEGIEPLYTTTVSEPDAPAWRDERLESDVSDVSGIDDQPTEIDAGDDSHGEEAFTRTSDTPVEVHGAPQEVQRNLEEPPSEAFVQHDAEETDAGSVNVASTSHAPMTPRFEVPHFTWPEVVQGLAERASNQLDESIHALSRSRRADGRMLAVAGVLPRSGCTTTMLAIALRLVQRGDKILLVDASVGEPDLAERLGVSPEQGWEDVLASGESMAEALIEAVDEGVTLLPRRPRQTAFSAVDGGPSLVISLETLRQHYDWVLVDCGHATTWNMPGDGDTLACGAAVDGLLLVCDQRRTTLDELESAGRHLALAGIECCRLVENFVETEITSPVAA